MVNQTSIKLNYQCSNTLGSLQQLLRFQTVLVISERKEAAQELQKCDFYYNKQKIYRQPREKDKQAEKI